jgi:DNA-binding IclR family transcriptional regulator
MREPAHTTATGKAIVAFLPPQILAAWLDRQDFPRSTKRTITSRAAFEKVLDKVRENGFATTDREEMDYVVGIAAPIFNFLSEPIAALNIWAPTNRCSLSDLLDWSDDLKSAAERVSKLIGGSHGQDRQVLPATATLDQSYTKAS